MWMSRSGLRPILHTPLYMNIGGSEKSLARNQALVPRPWTWVPLMQGIKHWHGRVGCIVRGEMKDGI